MLKLDFDFTNYPRDMHNCNLLRILIAGHKFLPIDSQCELHNILTFLRL